MQIQIQKLSTRHNALQLIQKSKSSTFELINIYQKEQLTALERYLKDNLRTNTFTLLLIKGKK